MGTGPSRLHKHGQLQSRAPNFIRILLIRQFPHLDKLKREIPREKIMRQIQVKKVRQAPKPGWHLAREKLAYPRRDRARDIATAKTQYLDILKTDQGLLIRHINVLRLVQPLRILIAFVRFVRLLLDMERNERDWRDPISGKISPDKLLVARRTAVNVLHVKSDLGSPPRKKLFPRSTSFSCTNVEKLKESSSPSSRLTLKFSTVRFVQLASEAGILFQSVKLPDLFGDWTRQLVAEEREDSKPTETDDPRVDGTRKVVPRQVQFLQCR
ncbi:zinc finger C-x8-C-x5-C-x3-H type family protein [Striga asiatica]|uniref:Zinc finger C-x8-C-x5-C-x3-H type family protein n=1 Tax=Striga asiatica TaxID=4170 RepID=A0A5A7R8L6_STRAF|nr:zinc finger C-x8-C-x5-C-x3-H type family protein [Striga asiatica]